MLPKNTFHEAQSFLINQQNINISLDLMEYEKCSIPIPMQLLSMIIDLPETGTFCVCVAIFEKQKCDRWHFL